MKKTTIIAIAGFVVILSSIYVGFSVPQDISVVPQSTNILEVCGNDTSCIVPLLWDLADTESQEITLKTFSEISNSIAQTRNKCHFLGHDFGHFLYSYTGNLSQSILQADSKCGGSIYHGIMQEYFKRNVSFNSVDSTASVAKETCNNLFVDIYSVNRFECAHGEGHGLVIGYNYDYLSAAKKCDEFEDRFAQRSCLEGATMEYDKKRTKIPSESDFENDIFYPCSILEDFDAEPCYNYHGGHILKNVNNSEEAAFKQCEEIKNEKLVRHCYYGIGIWTGFGESANLDEIIKICQKGNPNYQKDCFSGAVNSVTDQSGINQGFKLCKILPDDYKLECYNIVGMWIHIIHLKEKEIENVCSELKDSNYYQTCINANPDKIGYL